MLKKNFLQKEGTCGRSSALKILWSKSLFRSCGLAVGRSGGRSGAQFKKQKDQKQKIRKAKKQEIKIKTVITTSYERYSGLWVVMAWNKNNDQNNNGNIQDADMKTKNKK